MPYYLFPLSVWWSSGSHILATLPLLHLLGEMIAGGVGSTYSERICCLRYMCCHSSKGFHFCLTSFKLLIAIKRIWKYMTLKYFSIVIRFLVIRQISWRFIVQYDDLLNIFATFKYELRLFFWFYFLGLKINKMYLIFIIDESEISYISSQIHYIIFFRLTTSEHEYPYYSPMIGFWCYNPLLYAWYRCHRVFSFPYGLLDISNICLGLGNRSHRSLPALSPLLNKLASVSPLDLLFYFQYSIQILIFKTGRESSMIVWFDDLPTHTASNLRLG